MKQLSYDKARKLMLPGSVVAFGGTGFISSVIKDVTNCNVSHVGMILSAQVDFGLSLVQIIESTSIGDGFAGVQINRMSDRFMRYDGEVWILPLKEEVRDRMNVINLIDFLIKQKGKEYDTPQAIGSAIDFLPEQRENLDKLFCSELIFSALEFSGAIQQGNASEQTPADICKLNIFGEVCQIKGDEMELFFA